MNPQSSLALSPHLPLISPHPPFLDFPPATRLPLPPMQSPKLRVAVLGAGKWAEHAHLPGWKRDPRVEVVVLADVVRERAEELGRQLSISEVTTDWQGGVSRPGGGVVGGGTPPHTAVEVPG